MINKAVFFDRDNTLIFDKGYMFKTEDLRLFPATVSVLQTLAKKGYMLFIITNQSGIGRGHFTQDQMHTFNKNMLDIFNENKIDIIDIAFCPHAPKDNCDCRKPSPKLINQLCEKYKVNKDLSYMVGDKDSDIEAGKNAGLKSIKVIPPDIESILSQIN